MFLRETQLLFGILWLSCLSLFIDECFWQQEYSLQCKNLGFNKTNTYKSGKQLGIPFPWENSFTVSSLESAILSGEGLEPEKLILKQNCGLTN